MCNNLQETAIKISVRFSIKTYDNLKMADMRPTFKNCSSPITAPQTFFYHIQTKYYFLFQMLPSP